MEYIYQQKNWANFYWSDEIILPQLIQVRNMQARLIGRMEALGFQLKMEAGLETLTLDVLKTSDIEGEVLDTQQVRSSIARRLGMDISGLVHSDRHVEGVVEMMLDATQNHKNKLTKERLFDWHAALFPTGRTGMFKIRVGNWREDLKGPMQVVSGAVGKEKIHFKAPDAATVDSEMEKFLFWFEQKEGIDEVIKAAIAHLWFVTIHPFEDGNGRIARAIADMQLARADNSSQRFYSMSAQIKTERAEYYTCLEKTQQSNLDITEWLNWFLKCLDKAILNSEITFEKIIEKSKFWNENINTSLNERQRLMINRLLDGFFGNLNTSKWAKITRCSPDTALRDIQDLIAKSILIKKNEGGRSTNYELKALVL